MRALIISNGNIHHYDYFKKLAFSADLIICADGGAEHAYRMGLAPHVVIGDLDSINENIRKIFMKRNIEFLTYPVEKDKTDTQLAIEYALDRKCKEITMIGCLGSRFDHSFANVCLLKYILDRGAKGKIIDEYNEIYLIKDRIKLTGEIGEKVSLLPITEYVEGVTTKGLYYELSDAKIPLGISYGVSNVFMDSHAEIRLKKGLLLIIKARD